MRAAPPESERVYPSSSSHVCKHRGLHNPHEAQPEPRVLPSLRPETRYPVEYLTASVSQVRFSVQCTRKTSGLRTMGIARGPCRGSRPMYRSSCTNPPHSAEVNSLERASLAPGMQWGYQRVGFRELGFQRPSRGAAGHGCPTACPTRSSRSSRGAPLAC